MMSHICSLWAPSHRILIIALCWSCFCLDPTLSPDSCDKFTSGSCGSDQPFSPKLTHVHGHKSLYSTRSDRFHTDAEFGDSEHTKDFDDGIEKYTGRENLLKLAIPSCLKTVLPAFKWKSLHLPGIVSRKCRLTICLLHYISLPTGFYLLFYVDHAFV